MSHAERSLWSRRTVLAALAGVLAVPQQARADEPQRIAVFGDSQAQGLAGGLQRMFRSDKTHRVLDRSKISTGLINTSLYDWPAWPWRCSAPMTGRRCGSAAGSIPPGWHNSAQCMAAGSS